MRDLSNNLLGSFPFRRMALGGGGFTFAPKFADDGTMVVRTDTDQGLFRAPGATIWTEMLRFGDNITHPTDLDYGYAAGGTLDTAINHGDSQYMATYFGGYLWLTSNRFTTVTKANLTQSVMGGNGANSPASRIEYDSGTGVLIFCDPSTGVRYTTNGGSSFTTVASVPLGSDNFVAIDRSSSVSSGKHQIVYVASLTNGIYRTTTGVSGTFSLIASSPTAIFDIKVGPTGILWVVLADATAKKWTAGGGWVDITGSGDGAGCYTAVPDLVDEDRCVFINQGGGLMATVDGLTVDRYGPGNTSGTRVATDIPWLAYTDEDYLANGGGAFDPTDPTRLVIGQGIGVWETFDPLPDVGLNDGPTWNSITHGIDQLCVMEHKTTPLDDVVVAVLDRDYFVLNTNSPDRYPTLCGPSPGAGYPTHAQGVDWAGDDPSFLVGVSSHYPYVHYSTNRGGAWSLNCTAPASAAGGNIAASTTLNWVMFGTQNTGCEYTTDGGMTWANCLFAGSPFSATTINAVGLQRQCVVADKDNPGHFYCFHCSDGISDSGGVWKSTNGGAAWTRQKVGYITSGGRDFWNCKLRCYSRGLGQTPDLFWAVGDEAGAGEGSISSGGLLMSRDGGVTWATVPTCDEVHDIALGKAYLEHTYPALYINGWVSGVLGFYVCKDFNPATRTGTWALAGDRLPMGSTDHGWTVSASMNTHAVTIGHGGSGMIAGGHQWSIKAKAA